MRKLSFLKNWCTMGAIASLIILGSCKKDDAVVTAVKPIASFQSKADAANEFKIVFTNNSKDAVSYSWDFGDKSTASTDKDPTHTYAKAGTFKVVLEAKNAAGTKATFSADVKIIDRAAALTLLVGEGDGSTKIWKLIRTGTAMSLGADAKNNANHWSGSSNDGARPCLYDDTFTFSRDLTYAYEDSDTFWAEYGVFNGLSCTKTNTVAESCFTPSDANMLNECGDDIKTWQSSSSHTFAYDVDKGKITLTGNGAWIGIPKLGTTGEVKVPQESVVFDVLLKDGGDTGIDEMTVNFTYVNGDGVSSLWTITYVSYGTSATEPALVSLKADFTSVTDALKATFTNKSLGGATAYAWNFGETTSATNTSTVESPEHTYATAGDYNVTLTITKDAETVMVTKKVSVSALALTKKATDPTREEAKVLSIYSDKYTDITGVDTNPNWGQATAVTAETVESDNVLLLSGLNYQGIEFPTQDLSTAAMTHVHIDVWSATAASVNFFLIDVPKKEKAKALTLTGGVEWQSFDIALTDYSDVVDLTKAFQFKIVDAASPATLPSIYIDNIYFYKE